MRLTWTEATSAHRHECCWAVVEHVRPALEAVGDYDLVTAGLRRVAELGNGAMRQRQAWQRRHDVADVIAEAAAATLGDP